MCSILLLSLVAKCLETIDVCICCMLVLCLLFCCVAAVFEDSVLALEC